MAFEYDDTPVDSSAVAEEMSGSGLKPLSDEQKLARQIEMEAWRVEQQELADRRRLDAARKEAEAEAIAQQQRAIAAAQQRERANRETRERLAREADRNRLSGELSALRREAAQAAQWRQTVQGAVRVNMANSLMAELDAMIAAQSPPAAIPERETIIVEQPDDTGWVQPHRWFSR